MAVLNQREMDEALVLAVKSAALRQGVTLREFVASALLVAVGGVERQPSPRSAAVPAAVSHVSRVVSDVVDRVQVSPKVAAHDPESCRVYRCGLCQAAGVRDSIRSL